MPEITNYVLGIDLGVRSVGLALIDPEGRQLVNTAVRVFREGVEGDFESGQDTSRNTKRRQARLARRQTERRVRRGRKVLHLLQGQGLLPEGEPHAVLKALDLELSKLYPPHPGVPYTLRAKALDETLTSHELGRALYHLAQRRGFLSNRRAPVKDDEDAGKVKSGIESLSSAMRAAGARTLGEYFSQVDPHESRIRTRYTDRKMYLTEFDAICAAQGPHHPQTLTPEFRAELKQAIFHQRPLKDQSHLIGACTLIPTEKRAPLYHLDFQRFRLLDKVNNLRLADSERYLTPDERQKLVAALSIQESLTYAKVRELLGLPKSAKFSIEAGGEKKILGNVTNARFAEALNLRWDQMVRGEQDALVALWAAAPDDESFQARLEETGAYSPEEIAGLLTVRLPDDYGGFSLAAIRQLLPKLEEGLTTGQARKEVFPESFAAAEPQDRLPPVLDALPELRNPAVTRTLTELRKAVNELVRRYGKPGTIQIELARDLKRNKKDRQALTDQNRENEKKREKARAELLTFGLTQPSRRDIEKYILWEECARMCPYSGRAISLHALYQEPQFDIEHIIPHSRSLDDSFQNKTLCLREYNHRKHNRTPWEAFGGNPEEWEPMVARVKKFGNKNKLKRFEMRETETAELLEQFSSNQLNDTRYMSKLAGKFLGLLYGGTVDVTGTQRVFACAGGVTAMLRRMWGLDRILNPDAPGKSREDHRHHAVDAATVAVASRRMIQLLATAAGQAEAAGQRRVKSFEEPWPGFGEQLKAAILDSTTVSHKPERKLSGALHEETLYGRPKQDAAGKNWVHIRKPVHLLKEKDIEQIVDPTIRERVRLQLGLLGGDLKKLEREPATLETADGRRIPIKRVRIRLVAQTRVIGQGARQRNVIPGDNHHMEVVAVQKKGKTAYVGHVVSRLEATRRHAAGEPVVRKEHGPDTEFLFTLSEADMVVWKGKLWRVRGVSVQSNGLLTLSGASDARLKGDLDKTDLPRPTINVFCSTGGRKVRVTALGDIQEAHD